MSPPFALLEAEGNKLEEVNASYDSNSFIGKNFEWS